MVPKLGCVEDLGLQYYDVGSVVNKVVVKIFRGRWCGIGGGVSRARDGVLDWDKRVREWSWCGELVSWSTAFDVQGPGCGRCVRFGLNRSRRQSHYCHCQLGPEVQVGSGTRA